MSQLIFMCKSKEVPLEVKFGVSDLLRVYLNILYYTVTYGKVPSTSSTTVYDLWHSFKMCIKSL